MSSQMPTGYENYPRPEQAPEPAPNDGWHNPPAPVPVLRDYHALPVVTRRPVSTSRRALISGAVALGGVLFIGGVLSAANQRWEPTSMESTGDGPGISPDDPFDPDADEQVDTDILSFGGLDLDVPSGWTVMSNTDSRALLTQGRNRILMVSYEADFSGAADEIGSARKQSRSGFSGSASKPKVTDAADYQRAVVTASGTFGGASAREIAEVMISNYDSATVFIQQVLTAKPDSGIAKEAARLAADLRDSWSW